MDKPLCNEPFLIADDYVPLNSGIYINGQTVASIASGGGGIGIQLYGTGSDLTNAMKIHWTEFDDTGTYIVEVPSPITCPNGNVIQPFAKKWSDGVWSDIAYVSVSSAVPGLTYGLIFHMNNPMTDDSYLPATSIFADSLYINGLSAAVLAYSDPSFGIAMYGNHIDLQHSIKVNFESINASETYIVELRKPVISPNNNIILPFTWKWSNGTWSIVDTSIVPGSPINVKTADVNGVPRMFINNNQVVPTFFFGNTDIGTNITEQSILAASNGINLHSIIYNLRFDDDYTNTDTWAFTNLKNCINQVLAGDPNARIVLRVNVGCYFGSWQYSDVSQIPQPWRDELIKYTNGSYTVPGGPYVVSTSSDIWAEAVNDKLEKIVEFLRNDPNYADHIAGIHLEHGEWFQYGFRESGTDVSPVADAKFRSWLTAKYGSDAAFKAAWGVTYGIASAVVPRDLPNNVSEDNTYGNTLMLSTSEQRFVDYLDFISELTSSRINSFAQTVKEASNYELMVITFYGYLFELSDAQSGHYDMRTLLNSPYIDGFAGPVSYEDRTNFTDLNPNKSPVGATSAYMTVVDSIIRNGKIWFQESDQRTLINGAPDGGILPSLKNVAEIVEVHKREMGDNIIHGCGMWAMDLLGQGWLKDNAIWQNLAKLNDVYSAYASSQMNLSSFEVVLVVDENAEAIVGQTSHGGISGSLLSRARFEAYRAGVSFGFAELDDVIAGKFDDAKLYIFLNPYRLSSADVAALKTRLHKDNKVSVFMYGFGNLSSTDILNLTGMTISKQSSGSNSMTLSSQSVVTGLIKPTHARSVTPRYTVTSGQSTILGRYGSSGSSGPVGFALKSAANYKTIFCGATYLDKENIRAFVKLAGAQNFATTGDVLSANQDMIMFCATNAGSKTIIFNTPVDIYDYFTNTWKLNATNYTFTAGIGETRYIFYGTKGAIEAKLLPTW